MKKSRRFVRVYAALPGDEQGYTRMNRENEPKLAERFDGGDRYSRSLIGALCGFYSLTWGGIGDRQTERVFNEFGPMWGRDYARVILDQSIRRSSLLNKKNVPRQSSPFLFVSLSSEKHEGDLA